MRSGKYNDKYDYILSVIGVFWNFYIWSRWVPRRSQPCRLRFSRFLRTLDNQHGVTSGCEQLKAKNFYRHTFKSLKREGIQFQVCKNSDVKCSVVERAHRTILDRLYKYFTYKNTYRYIDVLPNLSKLTTIRLTLPLAWHRLKFPIRTSSLYGREWRRRGEAYASFG